MTINARDLTGAVTGNVISIFGLSMSMSEVEALVGIICSVIGVIVTIISALIIPLIRKVKAAKADGKITADEAVDIANTVKDGLEKTADKIESLGDKKDGQQ